MDEYSGPLEMGGSKRFKRSVETPASQQPIAMQRPPQQQQQQQQQQEPASLNVMFGFEKPGSQGGFGTRPLNKGDVEMLTKAKNLLEKSLVNPGPGTGPMEVASFIMQKCFPVLSGINWGNQMAYHEDFARVIDTCQRILTGQIQTQQQAQGEGK